MRFGILSLLIAVRNLKETCFSLSLSLSLSLEQLGMLMIGLLLYIYLEKSIPPVVIKYLLT